MRCAILLWNKIPPAPFSKGGEAPASSYKSFLRKSSVSEAPLFIFQLAAKIGLRFMCGCWLEFVL